MSYVGTTTERPSGEVRLRGARLPAFSARQSVADTRSAGPPAHPRLRLIAERDRLAGDSRTRSRSVATRRTRSAPVTPAQTDVICARALPFVARAPGLPPPGFGFVLLSFTPGPHRAANIASFQRSMTGFCQTVRQSTCVVTGQRPNGVTSYASIAALPRSSPRCSPSSALPCSGSSSWCRDGGGGVISPS
jgi:hypothetical protein